jgi:CHAT domain-containing protein
VVEEHLSRELRKVVEAQKQLDKSSRFTGYFRRRGVVQGIDHAMRYIDAHRLLVSRSQGLTAKLHEWVDGSGVARQTSAKPVLRFVVLPDRLVCIRVHGGDAQVLESEVNRVGIRALVSGFHENIRNFTDKPARLAEAERKLAGISKAILLTELTATLSPGTELRLLPDDCLHGVPFAALPLDDGTLLGDRFPISIGSEWQTAGRAKDENPPRSALLMGLSYQDIDDTVPLDGTREEVRGVLRQQPFANIGCEPMPEDAVSVPELLRRLPDSEYVHMACHGIFDPDDPASSGLKIYTAQTREVLSARDLSALDLKGIRHFTLSSCWGADDYASPGRYIVSLPETLLRGGVGAVLASLWPVTDAVARDFFPAYYKNLVNASPAAALQSAQKAVRAGEYTASYAYWAGYRVYTAG